MNGEKQKFIGGVDFDELRAQRVQLYNTITIDLATARTNEEMIFTGNYIYALEATDVDANFDVRFNELFRAAINIKKGRGVRVPFYRFYITNTAQAGKTLTLAIGIEASDFEVFDVGKALSITGALDIEQDDSWFYESGLERAFIGGDYQGLIADELSHIQLWNPAASGKTLYLTKSMMSSVGIGIQELASHNAALTNVGNTPQNKYFGSVTVSVAEIRIVTNAVAQGTLFSELIQPGSVVIEMVFNPAILIPEGYGFIVRNNTVNTSVYANFEWIEK